MRSSREGSSHEFLYGRFYRPRTHRRLHCQSHEILLSGLRILAFNRSRSTLDYALEEGIIDEALPSINEAFASCDYIFLCAPVETNASCLPLLKPYIKEGMILTDVGSTKTDIHAAVEKNGLNRFFIGGHPMAGSEKTGIRNSKRILLENAYYILTPTKEVDPALVEKYRELVISLKALPLILSCEEHDLSTAAISHLPHLIAASLVNLVKDSDSEKQTMKTHRRRRFQGYHTNCFLLSGDVGTDLRHQPGQHSHHAEPLYRKS